MKVPNFRKLLESSRDFAKKHKNAVWVVPIITYSSYLAYDKFFVTKPAPPAEIVFSQFMQDVEAGKIKDAGVLGVDIQGHYKEGNVRYYTKATQDAVFTDRLLKNNVEVWVPKEKESLLATILSKTLSLLSISFLGLLVFSIFKQLTFGRSKVKLAPRKSDVTFKDVAGIDDVKQDLQEVVDFLKDPQKFHKLGGKIPKGVLLMGSPGTGKTLSAQAIAGEAGVPFFATSGSEFVEMFVGVGASRVRDLFAQAKKQAPCIVFIDEIDALGGKRGAGSANDERAQTLNQLLVEMQGFGGDHGVIVIAATNRPDTLDPALMRPGRFDRKITVSLPDVVGRERILEVHTRKVSLASDVNLHELALGASGFSGAELRNLVNEAVLLSARKDSAVVTSEHFDLAKDKVLMGNTRSVFLTPQQKLLIAYHEAGHALVGLLVGGGLDNDLHKVSIVPRGSAMGVTVTLPRGDKYTCSKGEYENKLAELYGGREAEKLVFGDQGITTGAASDIEYATQIAFDMAARYGMTDELGALNYMPSNSNRHLGASPDVNAAVCNISNKAVSCARKCLEENRDLLDRIATALVERETLSGDDVRALVHRPAQLQKLMP